VFDDDYEKVKRHMQVFLKFVTAEKIFIGKDFSEGISMLIQNFGELSLDCPYIHKYTFETLISPLVKNKTINLRFLKWVPAVEDKKDDDDLDLDSADSQFKLIALILQDHLENGNGEPKLATFIEESNFDKAMTARRSKIEASDFWESLGEEYDAKHLEEIVKAMKE